MKLSKREYQVLNMIKDGMKNKEIATNLELDEKTVSTYILRIYKKLGLDTNLNRYALIMHAVLNRVFEEDKYTQQIKIGSFTLGYTGDNFAQGMITANFVDEYGVLYTGELERKKLDFIKETNRK